MSPVTNGASVEPTSLLALVALHAKSPVAEANALLLSAHFARRIPKSVMNDKNLDKVVVEACKLSWDESWKPELGSNQNNCSGFFKSVAKHLNIAGIPDDKADQIVDYITKQWTKVDTGVEAVNLVRRGYFVAVGLKSNEHADRPVKDKQGKPAKGPDGKPLVKHVENGHIAVIVDGTFYRSKYPKCWCGSTGAAQSEGDLSVGEVWSTNDRDNVRYCMYPTPVSSDKK